MLQPSFTTNDTSAQADATADSAPTSAPRLSNTPVLSCTKSQTPPTDASIATALGTLLALKGQNVMDGFHGALVASAAAAASLTALLMVGKVKMREG